MTSEDGSETPTLIYAIGRVSHGIEREMRRLLLPWRLSVPDYTTLSVIERRPGLSNAQLARRVLITPQSMFEVLASLERRKLVRRQVDARDGRTRPAALTPAGAAVLRDTAPVIAQMEEEILADIAQADREVLFRGVLSAMERLSPGLSPDPGHSPGSRPSPQQRRRRSDPHG